MLFQQRPANNVLIIQWLAKVPSAKLMASRRPWRGCRFGQRIDPRGQPAHPTGLPSLPDGKEDRGVVRNKKDSAAYRPRRRVNSVEIKANI